MNRDELYLVHIRECMSPIQKHANESSLGGPRSVVAAGLKQAGV